MSQNNYILSGEGFLKNVSFDKDKKAYNIEWTNLIREAKPYSYKSACVVIKNHNLNAFVWNPFAKEPIRNKWRVVRRNSHYSFAHDEKNEALEWHPEKVVMQSKSDINFLNSRNSTPETLYDSLEEATEVANEKNRALIEELQGKINSMTEWAKRAK